MSNQEPSPLTVQQRAGQRPRAGGVPYDANIQRQVGRLRGLAKAAGAGGILLGGVGVTAACYQIAHTVSQKEKNEIFVDTIVNTSASAGLGFVVGAFIVSNPIGWGTAVVLALGSAVISFSLGKVAATAYSTTWMRLISSKAWA